MKLEELKSIHTKVTKAAADKENKLMEELLQLMEGDPE